MKLQQISTYRRFRHEVYYDLVYEWEDIFSSTLGLKWHYPFKYYQRRKLQWIPFIDKMLIPRENTFMFEMIPYPQAKGKRLLNKSNIVPCIIDFFLRESDLKQFVESYNHNPIVCLSSKEAFDFVAQNPYFGTSLNIRHLPLSISDKYAVTPHTQFSKIYDLILMGRTNPRLLEFVRLYAEKHPNFYYVYPQQMDRRTYAFSYQTNRGEILGCIETREQYLELMRKGRCGLYCTPGIDGGEVRTNGFNQVTPRFLELVAAGCHVIARYKENSDTKYYELEQFSPSVDDFEQFEQLLNNARNHNVDMMKYSTYLQKHYSSVRATQLAEFLES